MSHTNIVTFKLEDVEQYLQENKEKVKDALKGIIPPDGIVTEETSFQYILAVHMYFVWVKMGVPPPSDVDYLNYMVGTMQEEENGRILRWLHDAECTRTIFNSIAETYRRSYAAPYAALEQLGITWAGTAALRAITQLTLESRMLPKPKPAVITLTPEEIQYHYQANSDALIGKYKHLWGKNEHYLNSLPEDVRHLALSATERLIAIWDKVGRPDHGIWLGGWEIPGVDRELHPWTHGPLNQMLVHHIASTLNTGHYDYDTVVQLVENGQVLESQMVKVRMQKSTHGTVREIAERLGISIAEVRKAKRNNTLDQLIAAQ